MSTAPAIEYLSPLLYRDMTRRRELYIAQPWQLRVGDLLLTVEGEWYCDGASIPRLLWRVLDPPLYSLMRKGAVVHDAGYRNLLQVRSVHAPDLVLPRLDRATVDMLFYEINRAEGYNRFKNETAWAGVRLFGGKHWRACA